MEKNEIIVTLVACAGGFLATYFNTAGSAHPKKWVRVAKFLPMVGFVAIGLGVVALQRPSLVTLWILLFSYTMSMLAEFVDTAISAGKTQSAWELFRQRLRHWPYVVVFAAAALIAGLFMAPRTHSKTETKATQVTTAEEQQARDEQRELDKIPR